MANDTDPTGIGGDGGIRLSNYIDFNEKTLRFVFRPFALIFTLISAFVLAWFDGVIFLMQGFGDALRAPYEALSSFFIDVIRMVFGASGVLRVAWIEAQADVLGAGLASFALGVTVAATALIVVSVGVDALG